MGVSGLYVHRQPDCPRGAAPVHEGGGAGRGQVHLQPYRRADQGLSYHTYTKAARANAPQNEVADKAWWFNASRRLEKFKERGAGEVALTQKELVWTETAQGPYISEVTSTIGVGTADVKQSRTTQTLDGYGNVTQTKQYDFGMAEASARTYTNTYLSGANWTSRYIRNRLKLSTLTKGAFSIELARNYYDDEPRPDCGSGYVLQTIAGNSQKQHDTATYTSSYYYRGNAVSVKSPGYSGCLFV
jgi:hypothetical protein